MSRILFFDVETTGLDPIRNDIIEIAGQIFVDDKFKTKFCIQCQPHNWNAIEQEALAVNGITKEKLKTFQTPSKALKEFDEILIEHYNGLADQYILCAHNLDFDKNFLMQWLSKGNRFEMERYFDRNRSIDTLALARYLRARGVLDGRANNLKQLCKQLDIVLEDAHKADVDTQALVEVFFKLEGLMKNVGEKGVQLSLFEC